jgi:hypothetical protein
MTNKEASDCARQIPFDADKPLPPDVDVGLRRIVKGQTIRYHGRGLTASVAKGILQSKMGVNTLGAKAPGHDAAVKAGKARPDDTYDVLAATHDAVEANYQQDIRGYRRRG